MAPKVCVPADFGRHHIGAPSHGNLTFNLQQGLQIKANSIILSLNSPVIDDLTTNLHLTSLEAEDFSREAVDCFIEASYTGEVDALNLGNFRDVNKMSVVFNVSWLVARCEKYFVSYLDKLDSESSYPDMLFAVEEAVYLLSALKKRDFLNLVVKKMNIISVIIRDNFINQYLLDLSASTSVQIDVCIDIVKTDVHVLVEILIAHFEKEQKLVLDENSRYLFTNLDMSSCHKMRPDIHRRLFSVLENLDRFEKEDFKLVLGKLEQNTSRNEAIGVGDLTPVTMPCFAPFLAPTHLNGAIDMLVANEMVDNLYKLIDGIWLRLRQCKSDIVNESVIEKLVIIKEQEGWQNVDDQYVSKLTKDTDGTRCIKFVELLKNCNKLVIKGAGTSHALTREYSGSELVEEIFKKDMNVLFTINDPKFTDMQCLLSTTAMRGQNPDSFTMKWAFLKEPLDQPLKLHFALERRKPNGDVFNIFPITWSGKPTCEPSRSSWTWGRMYYLGRSSESRETLYENVVRGNDELILWRRSINLTDENRYRFIAFVI